MFDQLPEWLQIFLLSMIPGFESKFSIPFAVQILNWEWWEAFPIALAGNMILVPFGLLFFKKLEQFLKIFKPFRKLMDFIFPRIRRKAGSKVQRYETAALLFFVVVPLPFTGAGLGTVIAYLFDLPFTRSLIMIFIGVVISAVVLITIFITGTYFLFSSFN